MNTNDSTTVRSKITSKNQVTIPKTVRNLLDLQSSDVIEWKISPNGTITIIPSKPDLWQTVAAQEKQFGNLSTPELDWGPDVESEDFD
ncbi:MAG: AbrB/MazE/SpoVT family DNA-binding domain-containing protein [Liquorilactobacillus hordei]|uniref:SpoVT-AbrB domain-containing protein n=1 Tax=Liquorilactobacillus satsumensis DSM 16230 = JCM 12392 TaxID=1423801 RepID=A0A0R1V117_9LACO|nr:AbrB/MazE/SpoVT family DNA-binding domain-containing protein [Liquorilactobacillus satsumensis]KRL99222.1 hypothetical protein FD50_GL000238 [Liquorilactobacillus satsumensis DSM 16230 = JCM 12392]MCC7667886.1 AbrB family transcriptional regulator [Liquorilactobacillus satsumensis]MCP9329836.1 AbrB/MazE/SpoVT family DNA-binding domain-containing protein [Liquorilactobacillus satsumensis]MCP9358709.1 AbrB/MazE/SpoVT family DNA-binding domain-containing protein [Liquorilactobacillus satsumensi